MFPLACTHSCSRCCEGTAGGQLRPLALPGSCLPASAPVPEGHPSMTRHQTRTRGQESLGGFLSLQEMLQLLAARVRTTVPAASCTAPCCITRTCHLVCTGLLVLLKDMLPEVNHGAPRAKPPTRALLPPPADGCPPRQQHQDSTHHRETERPETLGHHRLVTHIPAGQNSPCT